MRAIEANLIIDLYFLCAVKAIKVTYVHDDKAQAANNEGIRYELCQRDIRVQVFDFLGKNDDVLMPPDQGAYRDHGYSRFLTPR